ncbi:MAG: CDP-alcohol phosphatidyltransferase family protein [Anaerolineae bacterium]|jgi:phosphatidylglycerophosphate synthase|nr:CDP-alcohol phosphatidyltransferase family protein [Anaerolineae bacterium]MBT7071418.1 CDP-alcohol phosphatidyltransferase family protein [Anaerolineae bacterium]MBT7325508.1 CDP-alcohol phosphatidyltransferase family protein [Anaerolineae bacterium]
MFDTTLRNAKDRIAEPIARRMTRISPNTVSLIGVAFGIGSAIFAARQLYLWGLAFWLINRALDGLDGLLARLHDKQDDFGGYLDILLDFIAYAAIPLGFGLGAASQNIYLALAGLLSIYYLNTASWMYLAAILEKRAAHNPETATTIVMPAGLIGGFETIVAYSLFFLLPQYLLQIFIIFSALIFFTVIQRLIWAQRKLS